MLKHHNSSAILAVADLPRARAFYEGVLGLEPEQGPSAPDPAPDMVVYRTGATRLVVYVSEYAGTNRANAVVWDVPRQARDERADEFDAIVAALEARGAAFEHYPEIGRLEGNVHVAGGARLVWLKDPDGNLLHINSM